MSTEVQTRIGENRSLMGISNIVMRDRPPLDHAREDVEELLAGVREIVIVPYAIQDMDAVTDRVGKALQGMGIKSFRSPHQHPGSERNVLHDAEAIYIGGGNTGRLVANLYGLHNADGTLVDQRPNASQNPLADVIRERAADGVAIVGSSAGLNVFCRDVRTTNDMQAAVQVVGDGQHVLRIDGLGLLPPHLSINPHFQDTVDVTAEEREAILAINPALRILTDHQGEPRTQRLAQILEMDPTRVILALREGAYIVVRGMEATMKGTTGGIIFQSEQDPYPVQNGDNLSHLLQR